MRSPVLAIAAVLFSAAAAADESPPLTAPKGTAREKAVKPYNDGVALMLERRYADAQRRFEEAIAVDETLAEAHNNLAFSLRMQSRDNFQRSLREYARAIELNPKLAQAYMYRGVLYSQMGDMERARADLATLRALDPALAGKLEQALADAGRDTRDGLAGQVESLY